MKNKNIGILSFWTSDENYGQLLQLYSTNQVLLKLGYDPYIIKYDGVNDRTLKRPLYKRIITLIKNPERSLLQIKKSSTPPVDMLRLIRIDTLIGLDKNILNGQNHINLFKNYKIKVHTFMHTLPVVIWYGPVQI